jgi:hypothetical protein
MSTKQVPVTKEGLAKMRKELDQLVNVRRPEIAQRIHDEKELVGAQNTPEYEDARATSLRICWTTLSSSRSPTTIRWSLSVPK